MMSEKVRGGKAGVSLFVSMPRRYAFPRVTSFDAASVFAGVTWLRLPTSSLGPNLVESVWQRCAWAAPATQAAATAQAASSLVGRWDVSFMMSSLVGIDGGRASSLCCDRSLDGFARCVVGATRSRFLK